MHFNNFHHIHAYVEKARTQFQQARDLGIKTATEKFNNFYRDVTRDLTKEYQNLLNAKNPNDLDIRFIRLQEQVKKKLDNVNTLATYIENKVMIGRFTNEELYQKEMLKQQEYLQLEMLRTTQLDPTQKKEKKAIDFDCPKCGRQFMTSYGARKHLRMTHGIEEYLFCPHCQVTYRNAYELAKHLMTNHADNNSAIVWNGKPRYTCRYNGETFITQTALQNHVCEERGYLKPGDVTIIKLD